ncbi:hypothetical protein ANO14919_044980 [Xylariales sp. No.14919]|nr:hypothetical protein ANO14919_044980 [Xylariales sp. No.14919]
MIRSRRNGGFRSGHRARSSYHLDFQDFPFSRLPPELRLNILEIYALPAGPFTYISFLHPSNSGPDPPALWCMAPPIDVYTKEFWSLSRVNREARQAVLRGRQIMLEPDGSVLLVNWDRDLFIWHHDRFRYLINPPIYRLNIRHLGLSLPTAAIPYPYCYIATHFPGAGQVFAHMPALRRLYFIISRHNLPWLYPIPPPGLKCIAPLGPKNVALRNWLRPRFVSASMETIKSCLPKERNNPEELAWYQDFVWGLGQLRDDMQACASKACGRTINCEILAIVSAPTPPRGEDPQQHYLPAFCRDIDLSVALEDLRRTSTT